jgi:DNA-binding Xre family transcriptional regulator
MAIRAYSEDYLECAATSLAVACDYAVNVCGMNPDDFADIFVISGESDKFGSGNPSVVAGKSGIELVRSVVEKVDPGRELPEPVFSQNRSPEYWAGWAVAQYQWYSAKTFKTVFSKVPLSEIVKMYKVYHEMDIAAFIEVMDKKIAERSVSTNLKNIRENRGISQSELAEMSGVKLHSIQLYEQRVNDIDKAQAQTLFKISLALGCRMEDLLENPAVLP